VFLFFFAVHLTPQGVKQNNITGGAMNCKKNKNTLQGVKAKKIL
jgi:hypothetical protein